MSDKDGDSNPVEVLEGHGGSHNRSVRYVPAVRVRTRGTRGGKKLPHLVSGGDEHDLDLQARELEEERRQEYDDKIDRAYEMQIEDEDRRDRIKKTGLSGWDDTAEDRADRKQRARERRAEENPECCHYKHCPKKLPVDAYNNCHIACGGANCVHWLGCEPKNEVLEAFPKQVVAKQVKLKEKWFPPQRDPSVVVARRRNAIKAARAKEYSHTMRQEVDFKKMALALGKRYERPESLLGKEKLIYSEMAGRVFKLYQDDQFTSSATCIGDKNLSPCIRMLILTM